MRAYEALRQFEHRCFGQPVSQPTANQCLSILFSDWSASSKKIIGETSSERSTWSGTPYLVEVAFRMESGSSATRPLLSLIARRYPPMKKLMDGYAVTQDLTAGGWQHGSHQQDAD